MGIPLGRGEPVVVAPRGHRGVVAAWGALSGCGSSGVGAQRCSGGTETPHCFPPGFVGLVCVREHPELVGAFHILRGGRCLPLPIETVLSPPLPKHNLPKPLLYRAEGGRGVPVLLFPSPLQPPHAGVETFTGDEAGAGGEGSRWGEAGLGGAEGPLWSCRPLETL